MNVFEAKKKVESHERRLQKLEAAARASHTEPCLWLQFHKRYAEKVEAAFKGWLKEVKK